MVSLLKSLDSKLVLSKVNSFLWKIVLVLVFLRPFLSEQAFLSAGLTYAFYFVLIACFYLIINRKKISFFSGLNSFVFLFSVCVFISMYSTWFSTWSIFEIFFFLPNILIFYIVSTIDERQKNQLINVIFFAAILICIYTIYQYFIGFRHLEEYIKQQDVTIIDESTDLREILNRRRTFGTFISPNIFASYILMMIFVGIGLLTTRFEKEIVKINFKKCSVILLAIFVMFIALLFTKSQAAMLVFIISFILFLFYFLLPTCGFKKINFKHLGFILILFLLMINMVIFFNRNRMIQLLNLNDPNNSIVQRLYYWQASSKMIKDFFLTGVGWRKFGLFYKFYKPQAANISHYSHNIFLQVMAETGIFGLVAFSGIVAFFLKLGLRKIKDGLQKQALQASLFSAGCAFLLHNLLDISFYFGQSALFWWIILGLFNRRE